MAKSELEVKIAIIGSGLAGSLLALKLYKHTDVTVFERGAKSGEKPADVQFTGRRIGIKPNFYYGKGGTTNLWAGGMLPLDEAARSEHWPVGVINEIQKYHRDVVKTLYGEGVLQEWDKPLSSPKTGDAYIDRILYVNPYRFVNNTELDEIKIRYETKVINVKDEDDGAVVFYQRSDGAESEERFDVVIIACGGVNSPALLLRSELGGAHVGKHLIDHPMGFVAKVSACKNLELLKQMRNLENPDSKFNTLQKVYDEETDLWSAFYLRSAATGSLKTDPYRRSFKVFTQTNKYKQILAAISQFYDLDFFLQALEERTPIKFNRKYSYVLVVNEQPNHPDSQIRVKDDGSISMNWDFDERVEKSIRNNLKELQQALDCEIHIPPEPFDGRLYSGAHLTGTCRMSDDIASGVVNEHLKVHGCGSIYVCDGSVLPSTGCSNTGLTIASLALRLADRLSS